MILGTKLELGIRMLFYSIDLVNNIDLRWKLACVENVKYYVVMRSNVYRNIEFGVSRVRPFELC